MEYRYDSTKGIMIALSTQRAARPTATAPAKACPFCPGNEWLTPPTTLALPSERKWLVRSFQNKYPIATQEISYRSRKNLFWSAPAYGAHEVIVDTPIHEKLFQQLSTKELLLVLRAYKARYQALNQKRGIRFAYLFKNHGRAAGASVEHEHTQAIALPFVPELVKREQRASRGQCTFCKLAKKERCIVKESDYFVAFCPFASRFPGELWILPRRHVRSWLDWTQREDEQFVTLLRWCLRRAYEESANYTIAYHNAPRTGDFHAHIEIYPRPNVWGGIEIGTGLIVNTKDPALAARELRRPGPG